MNPIAASWYSLCARIGFGEGGIRRRRAAAKLAATGRRARYALNWRSLSLLDVESKYQLHLVAVER